MKITLQPSSHHLFSIGLPFIEPTASVTWQHIITRAWFQLEHSIHRVKLPKALLTAMQSNAMSKPHTGFCFYFYVLAQTILQATVKPWLWRMHFCNRQKLKDILTGITLAELEKKGGQKERRKKRKDWELDNWGGSHQDFPTITHTHKLPPGLCNNWLPTEMVFVS